MSGDKEFNLRIEYSNNEYNLIFTGNEVNISDLSITLKRSKFQKKKFILEKVKKGPSWWRSEIAYETENEVLKFKCTNSDYIDVKIMPNPTCSSWLLQGVLNFSEKQLDETIDKLKK